LKAAAPLISIPGAPAPAGAAPEWFEGAGGARLRAVLVPAQGPLRGSVVLSPGRSEPIEKYFEVISDLAARGFVVLAHDWRGQGLSQRLLPDRLKGHAEGYGDFVADHTALLEAFAHRLPKPWIALSHSMGACLTLLALMAGEKRLSGAVLTSPMLEVKTGGAPLPMARVAAWASSRLGLADQYALPTYDPLAERFKADALTHDPVRYARFKAQLRACPDLALGAPTWGWIDFALQAGQAIAAPGALEPIDLPVTIVTAGQDRLVWNAASEAAARRLPNGRCLTIGDAYHELLMETDDRRARFWRAFDEFADVTAPRA
jgi:lysophospholipase